MSLRAAIALVALFMANAQSVEAQQLTGVTDESTPNEAADLSDPGSAAEAGSIPPPPADSTAAPNAPIRPVKSTTPQANDDFQVRRAMSQSLLFVGLQHGFRMTEEKTRRELVGPFFKDWADSVKSLSGWKDGGRQFTNYVAHPMEGAILGYIQIQNDGRGIRQKFGMSGSYWRSRLKAMAWSAAGSAQFELGPLSQASIGNVGAGIYEAKKMTYVDLVITPTLGTVWIVLEDALDRHLIARIDRKLENRLGCRNDHRCGAPDHRLHCHRCVCAPIFV